jgi:hypothetical protein
VLNEKVYIYNFQTLEIIDVIDTYANPTGVGIMSYSPYETVISVPSKELGTIIIKMYNSKEISSKEISAHDS